MKEKNQIKGRVIRIADKGLNCGDNILDSYINKDGYIFSQSVKGAKKEVKDFLAYLYLIVNPNDKMAFWRVVNIPSRGVGLKTLEKIAECSKKLRKSPNVK